jgi:hypothetical protein
MNTQLWNQVANALKDQPSEQPVGVKANDRRHEEGVDRMDAKKPKQAIAKGYKAKQKGNPNKSYSVAAIDKARNRLG